MSISVCSIRFKISSNPCKQSTFKNLKKRPLDGHEIAGVRNRFELSGYVISFLLVKLRVTHIIRGVIVKNNGKIELNGYALPAYQGIFTRLNLSDGPRVDKKHKKGQAPRKFVWKRRWCRRRKLHPAGLFLAAVSVCIPPQLSQRVFLVVQKTIHTSLSK